MPQGREDAVYEPEIRRAIEILRQAPSDPWTVCRLAKTVGMSKSQFTVQFRVVAGTTPMECLRNMRMELARELLKDGRKSIQEVAKQVGYNSSSAFTEVFKRWSGVAPGTFRRTELKVPRIKFASRFRQAD